jgi:hypothetical protein
MPTLGRRRLEGGNVLSTTHSRVHPRRTQALQRFHESRTPIVKDQYLLGRVSVDLLQDLEDHLVLQHFIRGLVREQQKGAKSLQSGEGDVRHEILDDAEARERRLDQLLREHKEGLGDRALMMEFRRGVTRDDRRVVHLLPNHDVHGGRVRPFEAHIVHVQDARDLEEFLPLGISIGVAIQDEQEIQSRERILTNVRYLHAPSRPRACASARSCGRDGRVRRARSRCSSAREGTSARTS